MSSPTPSPLTGGMGGIPPVVLNLLILNGLFFLAQNIPPLDVLLNVYGTLWPLGSPDQVNVRPYGVMQNVGFYVWQPISSAFLHGDFWHLLFNMFLLWMFGGTVEQALGSKRFIWLYAVCVLGASALQLAVVSAEFQMAGTLTTSLGASGGVLGVLAAFGTLYPDQRIGLLFLPVFIPAKYFVLGLAALDLFNGAAATGTGIAHFAHLGGMISGFLLVQYWRGRLPVQPRARTL